MVAYYSAFRGGDFALAGEYPPQKKARLKHLYILLKKGRNGPYPRKR